MIFKILSMLQCALVLSVLFDVKSSEAPTIIDPRENSIYGALRAIGICEARSKFIERDPVEAWKIFEVDRDMRWKVNRACGMVVL